jgi:gamma-glutamyltranspeptidase/glutathione hydrolase
MMTTVQSRWLFEKTEVTASDGLVTAGKREAAEAGVQMLQQGGNAIDAAVAAGWAIGVVEPWMNGVGGSGAMVIHHDGAQLAIEFGVRAPRAARPEMYVLDPTPGAVGSFGWPAVTARANEVGHLSVGVPGLVAGLCLAHQRFGRLPLDAVMEPAVHLAEAGFEADWHSTLMVGLYLDYLVQSPVTAKPFLREGRFLPRPEFRFAPADRIVQKDLADTLRLIARFGPEAFYGGDLARVITEEMAAHDGLITMEDMTSYRPLVYPGGLRGTYRGLDVVGVPRATGGPILQEVLNILEGFELGESGQGTVTSLHLMAEACRRAYEDHFRFASDSDSDGSVPWSGLVSSEYVRSLRSSIRLDRASTSLEQTDPWAFDEARLPSSVTRSSNSPGTPASGHTTHVCAVDRDRNGVSITQTLGLLFGSGVTVPGTGIVLNDMMALYDPRPGNVKSVVGGKSQAAPYTPTVLLKGSELYATLGAPGGRRIPTAMAQVISNLVDHGMSIQEAISAPRLHSESRILELDDRFSSTVIDGLIAMGHQVVTAEKTVCSYNFANPVGVVARPDGMLAGGTDPLMPGVAVGVLALEP